jgi:spore coat polysaccharide biosynthesis protein SpsF
MNKNVVGIIQARLGSTRLPGKILKKVKGKTLLQHMVERLSHSKYMHKIVIATTTNPIDDALELFAKRNRYLFCRGSESDVLDRFYKAAIHFNADIVVRLCSDCPIIDSYYVDEIIRVFLNNMENISLVCNKMPFTFPDGFDAEVCSFETLETVWKNASTSYEREHVFPFLYFRPEQFPIINVEYKGDSLFHTHRFTLDYKEDYLCIKEVIENLYDVKPLFGLGDIIKLTKEKPEILEMNSMHLPDKSVTLAIDSGHSPFDNRKTKKRLIL